MKRSSPANLRDDRARIVPILQRQTGQLQRRRPAFGAVSERGDVGGGQA